MDRVRAGVEVADGVTGAVDEPDREARADGAGQSRRSLGTRAGAEREREDGGECYEAGAHAETHYCPFRESDLSAAGPELLAQLLAVVEQPRSLRERETTLACPSVLSLEGAPIAGLVPLRLRH